MDPIQTANDAVVALKLATIASAPHLLHGWILVPSGLLVMLLACFGIDAVLRAARISFPPSVACLVLLLGTLLLSERVLGSHRTRKIVAMIDVPANWALQWMSVFFTPSFVLLPLSAPIGVVEVFKMIAVFVVGFFITVAVVAYLTRGLQSLVGSSSKRSSHDDDDDDDHQIPLTENHPPPPPAAAAPPPPTTPPRRPQTPPQLRVQDHHHGSAPPLLLTEDLARHPQQQQQRQHPIPPSRPERWAAVLVANVNTCTYTVLLLVVAVPVFYSTRYAMPLHLTVNTLCYFAAVALPPPSWRAYLHPILTSSLFTVLLIWAFSATLAIPLPSALADYRTGSKYIQVWRSATPAPGAGDVFATLLDASIASLALPTFQHRRELRAHLVPLLVPSVLVAVASLFVYPPLCAAALAIAPTRSLAFVPRSLTLALATPAAENLGADVQTAAALAIVSGIFGVLCGQQVLAMLRIPEDDYVTRGITLGINSSAMATALLLNTDPRAAALSCLSMVLFGTVTVVLTAVPPVAMTIRSLAGL